MSEETRPRPGTTWRDLPPSPPIGEAPPPAPLPPVVPPPEEPDAGTSIRWGMIGLMTAVIVAVSGLLVWSPWSSDSDARESVFGAEEPGGERGSIFGDEAPDFGDGGETPDPFSSDPEPSSSDPEPFAGNPEDVFPPDLFDEFGVPDDFAQRFDEQFRRFFEENPDFGLITPDGVDDLLEEFGLTPDLLNRLRNGETLDELFENLPEELRDRLESGELGDFFRFGPFGFDFGESAFGLTYVPEGYQVTSARNDSDGRNSTTTVTMEGPDGQIEVTIVSGAPAAEVQIPNRAAAADVPGADAGVVTDAGRTELTWKHDDVAGQISAPESVPVEELEKIAAGAPQPMMSIDDLARRTTQLDHALYEVRRVIVGQDRVLERLFVSLVAGGHCLLEGVPGLAKTLTLSTVGRVMGGTFARLQFTPDLIPSDIIGTRVYRASTETFDVEPGPVFANFVLADEINRAPAKVQSALLEIMQERQVTIGGRSFPAPEPFLVLATQNPIESEGVYPLPEAQRDRFLMRVPVGYPTALEEREIVRRMTGTIPEAARVLDPSDVLAMQAAAREVFVDPAVEDYAIRIVLATRDPGTFGYPHLDPLIAYGASPRASIGLVAAGRALALLRGRTHTLPQDVYDVAYDVLNHRLVLSYDALADDIGVDEILVDLLSTLPAPAVAGTDPRRTPVPAFSGPQPAEPAQPAEPEAARLEDEPPGPSGE